MGWIASNKNRFSPDSTPCYGKFEKGRVYIIPNVLRQALKENGFDYSKVDLKIEILLKLERIVEDILKCKSQNQSMVLCRSVFA